MLYDTNICIDDIDVTMPKVDIYFVKVIDTKKRSILRRSVFKW